MNKALVEIYPDKTQKQLLFDTSKLFMEAIDLLIPEYEKNIDIYGYRLLKQHPLPSVLKSSASVEARFTVKNGLNDFTNLVLAYPWKGYYISKTGFISLPVWKEGKCCRIKISCDIKKLEYQGYMRIKHHKKSDEWIAYINQREGGN